ncbi:MAG: hypothetical protein ACXVP4_11765 [Bacteroidia bacterium]
MKTKKIILSIGFLFAIGLLFTGCKKSDRDTDTDISAARDNSIAENIFAGIFKSIGEFSDSTAQIRMSGCATYSIFPAVMDTTTWPKTLTINYGTTNCLCADGNLRRGIINAVFSGQYRKPGTVITISTSNYYHNNNFVQAGVHTITNNGINPSGNLSYTINVQSATITTSDGKITWNSLRTREWIAGETTPLNPWDDVYSITGSANGTGVNGNTFDVVINSPLIVALNCAYIEQGKLTLTPQHLSPRIIDFGNGSCDNAATVSINGKIYDITM